MRPNRAIAAAALFLVPSWLGTAISGLNHAVLADDPGGFKRDRAWIEKRIEAWQPTKEERAFDEIGWANDLREAERLAEQLGRPIFLFTYDGASMARFRC